ncbi:hypothetical protein SAMN06272759_1211, partial [Novosphingobium sp. B1]
MFECLILGDSIGLGTAKAINSQYAPRCDVQAVEGATAAQILSWRRGPVRGWSKTYALMTAIRDAGRVYSFAGQEAS